MNHRMEKAVKKRYKILSIIGKGSYGCVSKGVCRANGKEVALKVMQQSSKTEYELIKLLREIQIIRKLQEVNHII